VKKSEPVEPVEDVCSGKNILSNLEIGTSLMKLYNGKKPTDVQFDATIFDWAESTNSLLLCLSKAPAYKEGIIMTRGMALEVERLFLVSLAYELADQNKLLQAQVERSAMQQRQSEAVRREDKRERNLLLGIALLNAMRPTLTYQPTPYQPQVPRSISCTTSYVGTFAYTNCR
jgi:hypothetical protein